MIINRLKTTLLLLMALAAWGCLAEETRAATTASSSDQPLSHSRKLRKHLIKPDPARPPAERPTTWVFVPGSPEETIVHHHPACGGDVNGDGFADVLLGQPQFDHGRGRVLVFYGSPQGLKGKPDAIVRGGADGQLFGEWLEIAGDIDGDGFDDVLVSERPGGVAGEGAAVGFVLRGSSAGLVATRDWTVRTSAVGVGDLNGDGFDDVVTSGHKSDLASGRNAISVHRGSRQGLVAEPAWTLVGDPDGSDFGHAMAAAGDINDDGFDDLLVGALNYSGRFVKGGKAYLYHGSARGPSRTPDWTAEYPLPLIKDVDGKHELFFGHSVSGAGDVNGDGFGDVIIGAPFADRGDVNEGLAFVYHGSGTGLAREPSWWAESNQPHALFGYRVSTAGDVNGDGFDDVLVGAPGAADGQIGEGAAVSYHGSRNGLHAQPAGATESDHSHELFGTVVASAGDVNGDGYPDVLIFGPQFEQRSEGVLIRLGRAVVSYGGPQGLPFAHGWRLDKPLLLQAQQSMDFYRRRHGTVVYWGPAGMLLAGLIGIAISIQVRLRRRLALALEANRKLVAAQERARLARDVHDHLGSQLTQIALWTDIARTNEGLPPSVAQNLERVAQSARSAVSDVSQLVWAMNPANDSFEQFASYLGEYVVEFLKPTDLAPVLEFGESRPDVRMSMEMRSELFAVVKEALNNIVRHARATRVKVRLAVEGAILRLGLEDDGVGFDSSPGAKAGNGLRSIQDRVRAMGGRCQIDSEQGRGTRVWVEIDLIP